jgi:sortase A
MEEDMRRKVVSIGLIVLGLCIIGTALFMRFSAERKQKMMIEGFQKTLDSIGVTEKSGEDTGSNEQTSSNSNSPNEKPKTQNINTLGILIIPKINLNVAVAEGTDSETLKYAVGHFEGTAMPGEKGNFSVAGHRNYTYNQYFNRLDEIKKGDEIRIRTNKGEFAYEVFDTFVVEPTEVSVLDKSEDATITLVTCTPIRVATHRLIIKGRLKG